MYINDAHYKKYSEVYIYITYDTEPTFTHRSFPVNIQILTNDLISRIFYILRKVIPDLGIYSFQC